MIKDLLALIVGTVVSWHQYDLQYNTCHPQMAAAWVRINHRRDSTLCTMPSETLRLCTCLQRHMTGSIPQSSSHESCTLPPLVVNTVANRYQRGYLMQISPLIMRFPPGSQSLTSDQPLANLSSSQPSFSWKER